MNRPRLFKVFVLLALRCELSSSTRGCRQRTQLNENMMTPCVYQQDEKRGQYADGRCFTTESVLFNWMDVLMYST